MQSTFDPTKIIQTLEQPLLLIEKENCQISFTNQATCREFEIDKENLIGQNFENFAVFLDTEKSLFDVLNDEIIDSNSKFVKLQLGKDVKYFQASISKYDDRLITLLLIKYDKLPASMMENALLRDHTKVADFIENSPLPMHCLDNYGHFIWANKEEHELLGFKVGDLYGKHLSTVSIPFLYCYYYYYYYLITDYP
jgi:transcriptional regulator with PAS, ATPase and Fis domain